MEKGKATHSSILAWRIPWTVQFHRVAKSWTPLSNFHFHFSVTKLCQTLCNLIDWSLSGLGDSMDCSLQVPLSIGFPRQEYLSGLPFPTPEDLSNVGIEPTSPASPALQPDSLLLSHQGSPKYACFFHPVSDFAWEANLITTAAAAAAAAKWFSWGRPCATP